MKPPISWLQLMQKYRAIYPADAITAFLQKIGKMPSSYKRWKLGTKFITEDDLLNLPPKTKCHKIHRTIGHLDDGTREEVK